MQLEFDWDPIKVESNRRKHGVAFEAAVRIISARYPSRREIRSFEG
ncbi:hypothetical protein ACVOMS_25925 [Bradyrhizobium guangxiense]